MAAQMHCATQTDKKEFPRYSNSNFKWLRGPDESEKVANCVKTAPYLEEMME